MNRQERPAITSEVIRYRGEKITWNYGFALPYRWLGTLAYATLEDAKAAVDGAAWNVKD